jgi:hypothetical protein
VEVIFAALIRRHPHEAARIRRLRHWMMTRDAAELPSIGAASS